MVDFDNLKDKAKVSLSRAALTAKDLADKAGDKAKDLGRIAKLSLEINSEKDVIRKAYSDIGKLYYDTYKDNPDGLFIQLCDEVSLAVENISAKEAEITKLKTSGDDDDDSIVVEFEEIVNEGEGGCCCGGDMDSEECCCGDDCDCTPKADEENCCTDDENCECGCGCNETAEAEVCDCGCGCNETAEAEVCDCGCGCEEEKKD